MTVESEMSNSDGVHISDEMSIFRLLENVESTRSRLCLFGKPDDNASELITEQFEVDRRRFLGKWGFDILSGEPIIKHKVKTPKKKSNKKLEDKENIDISRRNSVDSISNKYGKENKCVEFIIPKNSLKMNNDKSYTKKARQPRMTDYWNYRKVSESSSCSDKEN